MKFLYSITVKRERRNLIHLIQIFNRVMHKRTAVYGEIRRKTKNIGKTKN